MISVLGKRILSGSALGVAIIGLLALDAWLSSRPDAATASAVRSWVSNGLFTTLVVLAFAAIAANEVTQFVRNMGYRPNRALVHVFAAGLVIGPYLGFQLRHHSGLYDEALAMFWVILALAAAFLFQAARRGTEDATINVASAVFIILYTGGLAGYLTRLRMDVGGWEGVAVLLFTVFLVKANDIGAFFSGMAFGRHKLIPWLSPKKTWEGFFGGIVFTVLCSVGIGYFLHQGGTIVIPDKLFGWPGGFVLLGLAMALASVAGDLVASLLKRDADVKDSGNLIPGMGGALDVLDSPLLAAPFAWFFWTRLAAA